MVQLSVQLLANSYLSPRWRGAYLTLPYLEKNNVNDNHNDDDKKNED